MGEDHPLILVGGRAELGFLDRTRGHGRLCHLGVGLILKQGFEHKVITIIPGCWSNFLTNNLFNYVYKDNELKMQIQGFGSGFLIRRSPEEKAAGFWFGISGLEEVVYKPIRGQGWL